MGKYILIAVLGLLGGYAVTRIWSQPQSPPQATFHAIQEKSTEVLGPGEFTDVLSSRVLVAPEINEKNSSAPTGQQLMEQRASAAREDLERALDEMARGSAPSFMDAAMCERDAELNPLGRQLSETAREDLDVLVKDINTGIQDAAMLVGRMRREAIFGLRDSGDYEAVTPGHTPLNLSESRVSAVVFLPDRTPVRVNIAPGDFPELDAASRLEKDLVTEGRRQIEEFFRVR